MDVRCWKLLAIVDWPSLIIEASQSEAGLRAHSLYVPREEVLRSKHGLAKDSSLSRININVKEEGSDNRAETYSRFFTRSVPPALLS